LDGEGRRLLTEAEMELKNNNNKLILEMNEKIRQLVLED